MSMCVVRVCVCVCWAGFIRRPPLGWRHPGAGCGAQTGALLAPLTPESVPAAAAAQAPARISCSCCSVHTYSHLVLHPIRIMPSSLHIRGNLKTFPAPPFFKVSYCPNLSKENAGFSVLKSGFDLFEIEPVRFRIHPEGSVGTEEGRNTRQIMGAGFGGGGGR